MLTLRLAPPHERAPLPPPQGSPGVHVWLNHHGGVVARGFRHGSHHWMAWPRLATFRFSASDDHIVAYSEAGAPADVVWDTFRRSVLPMAMQVQGWEALHASAVVAAGPAGGDGVVAFCAVSETGKSTVAFALRRRGFPQWSDDGVVFKAGAGAVRAVPLPFVVRLRAGTRRMFGGELPSPTRFEDNLPGEQRFREPLPIAAICLLKRAPAGSAGAARIGRMAPTDAFTVMLTHAHEFDPNDAGRRARLTRAYLEIVAQVPVFEVAFEPDPAQLDVLIDVIIEGLALERPAAVSPLCTG